MKKISLLFLMITVLLCSCNNQKKDNGIIGSWNVIEFEANTQSLPQEMIDGAKKDALTRIYTFHEDNTFTMHSSIIPDGEGGKWELSKDKKTITMNYAPGGRQSKESYQITSINKNSMSWFQDMKEFGSASLKLKKEK